MNRKVFIRLIVIASGIGIILLSLFAFQLGLDNDPGWGPRRIQLIVIGLGIILFGSLYWITPTVSRLLKFPSDQVSNVSVSENTKRIGSNINIWLILSGCFVLWLYIWIITAGQLEKWPAGRDYYWLLAQAFKQGQTYLLVEPNPELLKLDNPYDHHQREDLEYLWDTTLYNGKYYLYWGPVPAVLGVVISSITSKPVTDAGLVFSFVIGIAIFSVLLLRKIYLDFKILSWVFWGGVFASVVNIPLLWLLTRPTYYEASISGGQFFLVTGFYLLYLAFRFSSPHKVYLALSTIAFGLAGATRINLLPSVIFLVLLIILRIYLTSKKKLTESLPVYISVLLPISLIACSLLWYNYIRFGSIFELGHRYQLTGPTLTPDYGDISSVKYIVPNLYSYIFRVPSLDEEFPFLTIPWIKENMWPSFIRLPEHYYYTEPVAGILFIIPIIGFVTLLMARMFWLAINGDIYVLRNQQTVEFPWFEFSMFGYISIQMFILLIFISSAMRYLLDISPVLIVLSTIFVGYYVQFIEHKSYLAKMVSYVWILSSLITVILGFFIGFTGDKNNFLNRNPQLYYQLLAWFGG